MKQKRILIIEDDIIDYKVISRFIESDYQTFYDDGTKVITELIEEHNPDCVLLDYYLGAKKGIELLKEVKGVPSMANVPIIILTGEKNPTVIVDCMKNGAIDYLCKGDFGKDDILEKIQRAIETARLHTKIEEQQDRLNESERKYRMLYNNALVGMFTTTIGGQPIAINDVGLAMLGYKSKNEFLAKFKAGGHLVNLKDLDEMMKRLIKKGDLQNFQIQALTTKGEGFWAEVSLRIGHDRKTLDVVAVNITERKEAEHALRLHAQQLQERNEDLDAFSHTVAHDLKNPLATITGYSDFLVQGYDELSEDETQNFIEAIYKSSLKMQQIIDSLLLLAKIRKAEIISKELNMGDIVREAINNLMPMIEKGNAEIDLPDVWPTALGYAPFIEEVWTNLLSNAIKYSGKPPVIEIGVDTCNTDSVPKGMARFWIRDNGDGISENDQKLLFQKFERINQVKTDGHGLGLSIVRRIIEKLGGQVGVESNSPDNYQGNRKGSLFYFTLPCPEKTEEKT